MGIVFFICYCLLPAAAPIRQDGRKSRKLYAVPIKRTIPLLLDTDRGKHIVNNEIFNFMEVLNSWYGVEGRGHFCHVSLKAIITKKKICTSIILLNAFVKYLNIFVICKKYMFSVFKNDLFSVSIFELFIFKSLNLYMIVLISVAIFYFCSPIYTKSLKQCRLHLIFFRRPKLFLIINKTINIIFILQFTCKVTKIVIVPNSNYDEHCGLHR